MPESAAYLGALIVSITGLVIIDWRWEIAFFYDTRRTSFVLILTVLFFIVWDLLGIGLNIFYSGTSAYTTGIFLLPDFPLEELFFLILLGYTTLIIWRGLRKI
jgi:lycopene cyclase domain-containing protein